MPPWRNMYLCGAIILSMSLHFMILYVPFFSVSLLALFARMASSPFTEQTLFVITPLNWDEWVAVIAISFPVLIIDELFKLANNLFVAPPAKLKTE